MTDKERMFEIMRIAFHKKCRGIACTECQYQEVRHDTRPLCTLTMLADALVATGFGEVRKWQDIGAKASAEAVIMCAETERRAEVVERAYDNIMGAFHELLSAIFPDKKIDLDDWKKDNLANAEKELAEEDKK